MDATACKFGNMHACLFLADRVKGLKAFKRMSILMIFCDRADWLKSKDLGKTER
jgi:hypothetical protein